MGRNAADTQNDSGGSTQADPEATPSDVIGMTGVTATNATTEFVDNANVVTNDTSHFSTKDLRMVRNNDTQLSQSSLADFLARPIVVTSGNFATTDTLATWSSYSMPYTALTSTQGQMYMNKLLGFFGATFDMRFRLVVNSNKFQQGRYILGWVPLCGSLSTGGFAVKMNAMVKAHSATLVQRTTIPHVEIDLSTDTSAELVVPYTSVRNFYGLNQILSATDLYPLGYVTLCPYSPLVAPTGSTVAYYTLYVTFENIQLVGAASPQSGLSDRELSNKMNGPISGPALAISKGFREFGKIPLLSSYAEPVSWIADRVAKVSSMFGFSKPTAGDAVPKFQLITAPTHSQVDGDSDARSLALLNKSGVGHLEGAFSTELDEMDFSYIVRKKAWFNTTNWTTSQVAGNLYSISVGPLYPGYTVASTVNYPPVSFVSSMFRQWRGSLVYTFKIVKTGFHSGRLSFQFFPTDNSASYAADPYYVNREIVDIREKSEVEITVPYISDVPWTPVGDRIGYLSVDIVDPLVAPSSVSSTVTILCEVRGGPDFEVSIPLQYDNHYPVVITPQSGLNDRMLLSTRVGSSTVSSDPNLSAGTAIGDKVSNFRCLLKRFHQLRIRNTTTTCPLNKQTLTIVHDAIPLGGSVAGVLASTDVVLPDIYALVASCYGIVRGGVRLRNIVDKGLTSSATMSPSAVASPTLVYLDSNDVSTYTNMMAGSTTVSILNDMQSIVVQNTSANHAITVDVPQYSNTVGRTVPDMTFFPDGGTDYGTARSSYSSASKCTVVYSLPTSEVNAATLTAGYSLHNVYRAAMDDLSMGVFISVPPLASVAATSATGNFY